MRSKRTIRKIALFTLAAIIIGVISSFSVFATSTNKLSGEVDRKTSTLYDGVTKTYYSLSESSEFGLQKFWTVEFDPFQSDLYFDVFGAGTYSTTLKTVSSTVKTFADKYPEKTPIAAINGDLWMVTYAHARVEGKGTTYKGCSDAVVTKSMTLPRGFNMYGGEIITSSHITQETPYEGAFYSFGITEDGVAVLGNPQVSVKVSDKTQNKTFTADGINRLPANNAIIMYTDRGAASSCALDEALEIIVDCADYTVRHGETIKGKVTAITKPGETKQAMKENRLIFTVRGTKMSKIESVKVGDEIEVSVSVTDSMGNTEIWQSMKNCVGGHIPVIVNGVKKNSKDNTAYPMSVLGIKKDGRVVMLTNDGRQSGYSTGIKISKLQDLCEDLGIVTAFILDGGGSAAMVTNENGKYTLQNRPSDGSERSVVNTVILSYGPKRGGEDVPEKTTIDFGDKNILECISDEKNLEAKLDGDLLELTVTEKRTPKFTYTFDGMLSTSKYKYATITLKCISDIKKNNVIAMYLYSGANGSGRYGLLLDENSDWQTHVLDLSKLTVWSGKFTGIRFDLFDYTAIGNIGDKVFLKEIQFFATKEEADAHAEEMRQLLKETETLEGVQSTEITESTPPDSEESSSAVPSEPSQKGCKGSVGTAWILTLAVLPIALIKKKKR